MVPYTTWPLYITLDIIQRTSVQSLIEIQIRHELAVISIIILIPFTKVHLTKHFFFKVSFEVELSIEKWEVVAKFKGQRHLKMLHNSSTNIAYTILTLKIQKYVYTEIPVK